MKFIQIKERPNKIFTNLRKQPKYRYVSTGFPTK